MIDVLCATAAGFCIVHALGVFTLMRVETYLRRRHR